MFNDEVHSRYLSRPDRYDNLPNKYKLGGFPAKFVSSRISQNIFLHMIGNTLNFLRGGPFQNWSIPLSYIRQLEIVFL